MKSSSVIRISVLTLCLLLPLPALAQSGAPPADPVGATTSPADNRLTTLGGLLQSIAALEIEIEQLEQAHRDAETETQKSSISLEIEALRARIADLENDFTTLATGIDPNTFFEQASPKLDWKEELEAVFTPVLSELKEASAFPRELEALRGERASHERRLPLIEEAVSSLERLRASSEDETVNERLGTLIGFWSQQRDELSTQYEATLQRLEERESEQVGFSQAAGEILRIFFRKRFSNLLFALLAFGGMFFLLRYLHRLVHRYMPEGGSHSRQLVTRLADMAYYLFTVVVAIGALLVVLYLSADWLLLTVAVLVLIGVAWAARNAIPLFLDQAKLLLNVGAVREGERLIYHGIPWQLTSLSFFSELQNPALRGGTYRLPIKDLVGLRSRPVLEDEPWFPSQLEDWVILGDGTYGEVVEQTSEVVIVSTVRGSYKHYPTVEYLKQHPKNLSTNFFAVNHIVTLDYCYRDIVNTEIVSKLKQGMEEGFRKQFYGEHLEVMIVELKEMSASSLDVITIAKFRGGAASEYTEIGWKLQQLALDICNENGWKIPFRQLVVHRPETPAISA